MYTERKENPNAEEMYRKLKKHEKTDDLNINKCTEYDKNVYIFM